MLKHHLQLHGEIHALGEIFDSFSKNWRDQSNWLDELYVKKKFSERKHKAIGFTTKLTSVADANEFKNYIEKNQVRVIHLNRANPIKLAISVIRAEKLRDRIGDSNITKESDRIGRMHISVDELRQGLRRKKRFEELAEFIQSLDLPKIEIFYEQFLEDERETLGTIWDFLEVEHVETKTKTLKNTSDNLEEVVSNLAELRAAFPEYDQYF